MNIQKKSNSGMALSMVVIFILVMMTIGTLMLSVAMSSNRAAAIIPRLDSHHMAAEAAMNKALPGFVSYLQNAEIPLLVPSGVDIYDVSGSPAGLVPGTPLFDVFGNYATSPGTLLYDSMGSPLYADSSQTNRFIAGDNMRQRIRYVTQSAIDSFKAPGITYTQVENHLRTDPAFRAAVSEEVLRFFGLSALPSNSNIAPLPAARTTAQKTLTSAYFWHVEEDGDTFVHVEGFGEPAFVDFVRAVGNPGNPRVNFELTVTGTYPDFPYTIAPYVTVESQAGSVTLFEDIVIELITTSDIDITAASFQRGDRGNSALFQRDTPGIDTRHQEVRFFRGADPSLFPPVDNASFLTNQAVGARAEAVTINSVTPYDAYPHFHPNVWSGHPPGMPTGMTTTQIAQWLVWNHPYRDRLTHIRFPSSLNHGLLDFSNPPDAFPLLEAVDLPSATFESPSGGGMIGFIGPYRPPGSPLVVVNLSGAVNLNSEGNANPNDIRMHNAEFFAGESSLDINLPPGPGGNPDFGNGTFSGSGAFNLRGHDNALNILPFARIDQAPIFLSMGDRSSITIQPANCADGGSNGTYYGFFLAPRSTNTTVVQDTAATLRINGVFVGKHNNQHVYCTHADCPPAANPPAPDGSDDPRGRPTCPTCPIGWNPMVRTIGWRLTDYIVGTPGDPTYPSALPRMNISAINPNSTLIRYHLAAFAGGNGGGGDTGTSFGLRR